MSGQLRSPQGLEGIFDISGDRISAWQPVISCPVKDLLFGMTERRGDVETRGRGEILQLFSGK